MTSRFKSMRAILHQYAYRYHNSSSTSSALVSHIKQGLIPGFYIIEKPKRDKTKKA